MNNEIQPWLNFKNFEKNLTKDLEEALKTTEHPITLNEFYVLYYLDKNKTNYLTISEISEKIGLSLSATSRLLAKFEETCKLITRTTCADDKRAIRLSLTSDGEKRLQDSYNQLAPVLNKYKEKLALF